jgi:spore coat protein H
MPFWQSAEVEGRTLRLSWDEAVDFQGDAVSYTAEVARQPDFAADSLVFGQSGLTDTEVELPAPPAGTYYLRVTARDARGHEQSADDDVETPEGLSLGVREFTVP